MRIFCIGRNYAEHARELANAVPDSPVVFMKPETCIVPDGESIPFPSHGKDLHHEAEVVLEIGRAGKNICESDARNHLRSIGLGLDLTLRDIQTTLKEKGLPWEKAKAFDASAPLGPLIPVTEDLDLANIHFTCTVNQSVRQQGHTADMLFSIPTLVAYLSRIWCLQPHDLIFTGTPAGVAALHPGDTIELTGPQLPRAAWTLS
jgi:2-keto-4-pentenoate hydratase/2-oxohepta-3-ene-1,7-dioic acid hydratase in catechol pathway